MDIEKLIEAAKEIDALARKQDARTKELGALASEARAGASGPEYEDRKRRVLNAPTVTDYGDSVRKLREALHSKQRKIAPSL